jgi:activator of HSP90 ATPase
MSETIQQTVTFPARAAKLYALYADGKLHTAATGQKASVGKAAGGRFSAFNGMITGKLLHIKRNRILVQTWRGKHWKTSDPDSVLVLRFMDTPKGGTIKLVHANVPKHDQAGVAAGWKKFYWDPWMKLLAKPAKPAQSAKRKPVRRKAVRRKAPAAAKGRKTARRGRR